MKIKKGKEKDYEEFVKLNSNDGYSYGVVKYMKRWADLLENKIGQNDPKTIIIEYADKLSFEADIEGITGFMYGCAVQALDNFWEYGDILRAWHNKQYGYEGEGTVNPAVLTIG